MPQPDFSYIRLSHSLPEPLKRKKKIRALFSILKSQFFMLQQHGLWLHQNFYFISCDFPHFLFSISFIQQHPYATYTGLSLGLPGNIFPGATGSLETSSSISHVLDASDLFFKAPTTHMWLRCICLPVPTNAVIERSFLVYTLELHCFIYSPHPTGCPACLLWETEQTCVSANLLWTWTSLLVTVIPAKLLPTSFLLVSVNPTHLKQNARATHFLTRH